jgi:hypothetical protein
VFPGPRPHSRTIQTSLSRLRCALSARATARMLLRTPPL